MHRYSATRGVQKIENSNHSLLLCIATKRNVVAQNTTEKDASAGCHRAAIPIVIATAPFSSCLEFDWSSGPVERDYHIVRCYEANPVQ